MLQAARRPEFVFTWTGAITDALNWSFYLVVSIWWIKELSLSPVRLVSLGVIVQITIIAMEVPSGVAADLLSRKHTIVLSRVLMGVSILVMVVSRNYLMLLGAQTISGVSWALRSGGEVAWLTDELRSDSARSNELDLDETVAHLLLRKHRLGLALAVVGIPIATVVGMRSLVVSVRMAGAGYLIVALLTAVLMTERGFVSGSERGETFLSVLRQGARVVKARPRLRRIVLVAAGISLAGDTLDFLGLKRFLDTTGTVESSIVPMAAWFLVAVASGFIVNSIVSRKVGGSSDLSRITATMFVAAAFGIAMAALSNLAILIGLGLIVQDSMRETFDPVLEGWVNRDAPPEVRATIHSMVSQAQSVTDIGAGLVWGLVAQLLSVPTALLGIAFVVAGVAWLAAGVPSESDRNQVEARRQPTR